MNAKYLTTALIAFFLAHPVKAARLTDEERLDTLAIAHVAKLCDIEFNHDRRAWLYGFGMGVDPAVHARAKAMAEKGLKELAQRFGREGACARYRATFKTMGGWL
ncbi:hypothetical protein [Rhizobium sp. FKL33]|uniref:hypothetical protein n=1 Tax=Rhizobium sp. FKL33 TaxID=2562307 RepID=UPI0010C09CF6|nr:hypothetical protein [Rhizobium sp. FKL33]